MRQDVTRANNSKWRKETDLLKSGLEAGMARGVNNLHDESKIFNSGNLHFLIDGFFEEEDLCFLGKHWCVTYQRAVVFTNFSCVNSPRIEHSKRPTQDIASVEDDGNGLHTCLLQLQSAVRGNEMILGAAVSCGKLTEQSRAQKEAGNTLLTYEFTGVSNTMAKRERVGCGVGDGECPCIGREGSSWSSQQELGFSICKAADGV